MIIEILCSQLCNLFGDSKNIQYLQQCLPEAEFVILITKNLSVLLMLKDT